MTTREPQVPHLYNLTKITGRRNKDDRTVVIKTFEVNRRRFVNFLKGVLPALLITLPFAIVIGVWALFVFGAAIGLWMVLFDYKSTKGLQIPLYQVLDDRRKTLTGTFMQSGQVLDDSQFDQFQVMRSTVPLQRPRPADEVEMALVGEPFDLLTTQGPALAVPTVIPPSTQQRRRRWDLRAHRPEWTRRRRGRAAVEHRPNSDLATSADLDLEDLI